MKGLKGAGRFARQNAIALLALFVALGGTATAIQRNSVGTPQLRNNAVKAPKLASNSVKTRHIARNAVSGRKIAPNAVGGSQIGPNAVGPVQLAPGSVGAGQIASGAVGPDKLGPALAGAAQVVTIPRVELASSGENSFATLYQRGPFEVRARCFGGGGTSLGDVSIASSEAASTTPVGTNNPPGKLSVLPEDEFVLVPPRVSGGLPGTASSRGVPGFWAVTSSGRYLNLGVFVTRTSTMTETICSFTGAGFAN